MLTGSMVAVVPNSVKATRTLNGERVSIEIEYKVFTGQQYESPFRHRGRISNATDTSISRRNVISCYPDCGKNIRFEKMIELVMIPQNVTAFE